MARLRTEEVRRLMNYLSQQIRDPKRLAEIEDALRDEYAEEFLREPELLVYFPEHTAEIFASGANWRLRIIPHALLRMVQRATSITARRDRLALTFSASTLRLLTSCQAFITSSEYRQRFGP